MIMKYTEIELQYEDIMWFGVDRNGVVFECTSGGVGCVPLFLIILGNENNSRIH